MNRTSPSEAPGPRPAAPTTRLLGRWHLAAATLLVGASATALLGACGGDDTTAASASTQQSPAASAPGGGRGPGGMDMAAVQQCLAAAGITLPTPTGTRRPSWSGTRPPRPSGSPRGTRAWRPDGDAPDGSGRYGGGMGEMFQRDDVKAALSACGITVPTFGGRLPDGARSPGATVSPTA